MILSLKLFHFNSMQWRLVITKEIKNYKKKQKYNLTSAQIRQNQKSNYMLQECAMSTGSVDVSIKLLMQIVVARTVTVTVTVTMMGGGAECSITPCNF